MADIKINGVTYEGVPRVDIPTDTESTASFYEVSGSQEITENGDYDVTTTETVTVNVEGADDELADLWLPEDPNNNYFMIDTDVIPDGTNISVSSNSRTYVIGHLENKEFVEDGERYTGTSFDLSPYRETGTRVLKTFGWAEKCTESYKNTELSDIYSTYYGGVVSITNGGAPIIISPVRSCKKFVYCGDASKTTQKATTLYKSVDLKYVDVSKYDFTNANMNNLFANANNSLTTLKLPEAIDCQNSTSVNGLFWGLRAITELPDILINTQNVTNFSNMFYMCSILDKYGDTPGVIDISGLTMKSVTTTSDMFYNCASVKKIKLPDNMTMSDQVDISGMFKSCNMLLEAPNLPKGLNIKNGGLMSLFDTCYLLRKIDLTNVISSVSGAAPYMFYRCFLCTDLIFDGCDLSGLTGLVSAFSGMYSLENFSIKDGALPGIAMDFSDSTILTHESLINIINAIPTVTSTKKLTLGSTNLAKLTDEEKTIATDKGWTLA